jgi:hypothetical protein
VIKGRSEQQRWDFLRHVAGYTRRDEISNLTIRSGLQTFNINDNYRQEKGMA